MTPPEITAAEQTALDKALLDALNPLASAMRARATGLAEERMWDADPIEVTLSILTTWKVVDAEVKRLTAIAAKTAGSYGASYERLGAAWGITRQGARKKWPDAIDRSAPAEAEASLIELFGGSAELSRDPSSGGWRWAGKGADGTRDEADSTSCYATKEEAAGHAGAFLKEHVADRRQGLADHRDTSS
ncbi:hypothetical protein [Streptomyces sp. Ncost-T10-10d]|uniref:hypothetical protein n=1 Tax=Streptomyces sp. Ncost-T10-10d TaxID=1839774 RepID=UPI00081D9E6A|nr:hypothetical protein [Streptomyces sp. Ncost-T10-10d]SCF82898.1 hypothetical protein GA0115254_11855 [Streptomyces sp. Ncost-T10-10d]